MTTFQTLDELYKPVDNVLQDVRSLVRDLWADVFGLACGQDIAETEIGGKLLRPALCLLSAGSIGCDDLKQFVPLAASYELLHLAALAHDDVIDGSDMRRGTTSLNALWGAHAAVLSGDYLVARALEILVRYGSCTLLSETIDTIRQMSEGELKSFAKKGTAFTQEDCLDLAHHKTASLFAVTCAAPALLTDKSNYDILYEYGLAVGIAFQLTDDVLDLSQNTDELGKPRCADLAESKETLPIILMSAEMDEEDRKRLESLHGADISDDDCNWVADMLGKTGAGSRTIDIAREYSIRAKNAIDGLPETPFKESMMMLADFVLARGS